MQEENQENNEIESSQVAATTEENKENQAEEVVLEHIYFEVGNDLTSKPNALADLIQTSEYPHVQIVCNSPSEADFVDVILRKRNISCGKLIGHVPYTKVSQTLHQLATGAINVVIVTDISANEIDPGQFDISINYAIHEDPEIYLHRCTPHTHESKLRKVYSLIGPLDFGNFHYLKKVVDFEFSKGELPSKEDVAKSEISRFFTTATQSEAGKEPKIQEYVSMIKGHADCDTIIGYLLHNTLNVLPELQSRGFKQEDSDESPRRGHGERSDRYGDDRGERRYDDRKRGGRYNSHESSDYEGQPYDNERRSPRPPRENYEPPKRDVRFYIGQGLNNGITDKGMRDVLENEIGLTVDQIKRISIRDNYAFIDFDEESADEIIQKLQTIEFPEAGNLYIRKATVVNAPRTKGGDIEEGLQDDEAQDESIQNDETQNDEAWCNSDEGQSFADYSDNENE